MALKWFDTAMVQKFGNVELARIRREAFMKLTEVLFKTKFGNKIYDHNSQMVLESNTT